MHAIIFVRVVLVLVVVRYCRRCLVSASRPESVCLESEEEEWVFDQECLGVEGKKDNLWFTLFSFMVFFFLGSHVDLKNEWRGGKVEAEKKLGK